MLTIDIIGPIFGCYPLVNLEILPPFILVISRSFHILVPKMTARTCQLCGKPLSRLRVGGDGDFCSREHRNQHRLRLAWTGWRRPTKLPA